MSDSTVYVSTYRVWLKVLFLVIQQVNFMNVKNLIRNVLVLSIEFPCKKPIFFDMFYEFQILKSSSSLCVYNRVFKYFVIVKSAVFIIKYTKYR